MKATMAALLLLVSSEVAGLRSENFLVNCQDKALQASTSHYAEVYRREIALQWIGEPQPRWSYPHIINVSKDDPHGENNVVLNLTHKLDVYNVDETQILYSTLPHEVCHSVLLTYCGKSIPLWASEGIAMSCERIEMGAKDPARFARMAEDRDLREMFNRDTYPIFYKNAFYGQAFSVTQFLVERSGRKEFLAFIQQGKNSGWTEALEKTYQLDWATLQSEWWIWHQAKFGG